MGTHEMPQAYSRDPFPCGPCPWLLRFFGPEKTAGTLELRCAAVGRCDGAHCILYDAHDGYTSVASRTAFHVLDDEQWRFTSG